MYKLICYPLILLGIYNTKRYYKLYRHSKPITIVEPSIINKKIINKDNNKFKKLELEDKVIFFRNTLEKNFNKDNLAYFYNNINKIKISKSNFLFNSTSGEYYLKKNKITVSKKDSTYSIDHELLHMSSSYYDKNRKVLFSGFEQITKNGKKEIGRGLTEGYTTLLDRRYFNPNKQPCYTYSRCEYLAMLIELLVGKDIMEKAYFTANLSLIISELEKFDTKENIIKVIRAIDIYFDSSDLYQDDFIIPIIKMNVKIKACENEDYASKTIHKWFDVRKELEANIEYQKRIQ